ncbi:MAG: hypothetical protein FWE17_00745 [Alphaproteobacteria bacterium]|nr:hypothetical protein [Alphaproteobacteria bacterium]MCL2758221.1 hypothetical protein [Alphaproteobacteria bacterium]
MDKTLLITGALLAVFAISGAGARVADTEPVEEAARERVTRGDTTESHSVAHNQARSLIRGEAKGNENIIIRNPAGTSHGSIPSFQECQRFRRAANCVQRPNKSPEFDCDGGTFMRVRPNECSVSGPLEALKSILTEMKLNFTVQTGGRAAVTDN